MTHNKTAPRHTNESPLARMRFARGITQTQLAEMTGYYQKDISRWERGEHVPSVQIIAKLARALECSIEDIL